MGYSAIICTKNEQFIICLGGCDDYIFANNNIMIYDFKTNKFSESAVQLPKKENVVSVMINKEIKDELLTFGFVNDCYRLQQFKSIPLMPYYIIKCVSSFICNEFIHIIGKLKETSAETHWKINVDCVLKSK